MKTAQHHLIIVILTICSVLSLRAQQYSVEYETETVVPDSIAELLPHELRNELHTKLYIQDSLITFEMEMVGRGVNARIVINEVDNEGVNLVSTNNQKIAEKLTDSIIEQRFRSDTASIEFFDDTKTILGETCLKAETKGQLGGVTTIWYVPGPVPSINLREYLYSNVPGIILETSTEMGGTKLIVRATSFSREVENPGEVFDFTIPEGYLITPKGLK